MKPFRLSCDYMSEAVISKTTDDAGVTRLVENFEAMAAPWLSGIRDIESLARELNLTVIDNFKTAALHERSLARPRGDIADLRPLLSVHCRIMTRIRDPLTCHDDFLALCSSKTIETPCHAAWRSSRCS